MPVTNHYKLSDTLDTLVRGDSEVYIVAGRTHDPREGDSAISYGFRGDDEDLSTILLNIASRLSPGYRFNLAVSILAGMIDMPEHDAPSKLQ